MKAFFLGALCAVFLAGCSKSEDTVRVGREFLTMADCLHFIEEDLGEGLQVQTDEANNVSGKSSVNGLFFRCEAKSTGSRGVVLEGRWDRLKQ